MIIIAQREGQLGNRLILFSHLIAFAQEHHLTVVNLAFDEYAPLFQATQGDLFCRYPPVQSWIKPTAKRRHWLFRAAARLLREVETKRLPFVRACRLADGQSFCLDAEFAETARRNIVFIGGWLFRKPAGFSESAPALRQYFRPTEPAQENIQRTVQAARAGHDLLIGVHLRHGDYRSYEEGRYFYTAAQYAALMAKAAALFAPRRAAFLLCSNEPQEAALFADFPVTFGTGALAEDLYALAECDYLIGPPSTFTVWASFYGDVPLCHVFSPDAALTREDFHLSQDWGRLF